MDPLIEVRSICAGLEAEAVALHGLPKNAANLRSFKARLEALIMDTEAEPELPVALKELPPTDPPTDPPTE